MDLDERDELVELEFDAEWNSDIEEDVNPEYARDLSLYPRDWTVETIVNQIDQENINLNPKFQRRNAWNDHRRSSLIESLILGIPVPEIMLAEDSERRRKYIVIDGKQRLMTIAGFFKGEIFPTWDRPKLKGLRVLKELNGKSYEDLKETEYGLELQNASIRCSIISNYNSTDVLYDIFYRLNTGSVPLSSQELRQVLNPGKFADYLIEITNEPEQPIHKILGLREPDKRLRDVELVLRFMSFVIFSDEYQGNLKRFLDVSMRNISDQWETQKSNIDRVYALLNNAITLMLDVYGNYKQVGRKFTRNKWETRFNKVLFEVQAYYFTQLDETAFTDETKKRFIESFKELSNDVEFRTTIESSTKNLEQYRKRYQMFGEMVERVLHTEVTYMEFTD